VKKFEVTIYRPWHAEITVPGTHPSLNDWSRVHFRERARLAREWKDKVALCAHGIPRINGPVVVTVRYYFADSRARDFDNYAPKFILDGLKGLVIDDDNSACITELRLRMGVDRKNPHTVITIETVPPKEIV
jgi:hypothetical protein